MGKEPVCPSLNRLAALMQRVHRVRELIVADPLARVALVSVQTDLLRVHKLIERHRATCAHCKLNRPLREHPSNNTLPSPKVVPIKRALTGPPATAPRHTFSNSTRHCTTCQRGKAAPTWFRLARPTDRPSLRMGGVKYKPAHLSPVLHSHGIRHLIYLSLTLQLIVCDLLSQAQSPLRTLNHVFILASVEFAVAERISSAR